MVNDKIRKNLYFSISIWTIFLILGYFYIEGDLKLGKFPFGIISGITVCIQIILFIFSIKDILKYGFRLRFIWTLIIEISYVIFVGYLFIIWAIFILPIDNIP